MCVLGVWVGRLRWLLLYVRLVVAWGVVYSPRGLRFMAVVPFDVFVSVSLCWHSVLSALFDCVYCLVVG